MDTNQQLTWPPPPTVSDPLAAHDAFLTALVCAPLTKRPLSRLRLVMALQKKTGMRPRQCSAFVNDYCDRKGIFPWDNSLSMWLPILPFLVQLALVFNLLYRQAHLGRELAAVHTHQARRLILGGYYALDQLCIWLIVASAVAALFVSMVAYRRIRRKAEDARRKVGDGVDV